MVVGGMLRDLQGKEYLCGSAIVAGVCVNGGELVTWCGENKGKPSDRDRLPEGDDAIRIGRSSGRNIELTGTLSFSQLQAVLLLWGMHLVGHQSASHHRIDSRSRTLCLSSDLSKMGVVGWEQRL
jgi:hypothetical protein